MIPALRDAFPGAHLAWAVDDRFEGLFSCVEGIDRLFVYPRRARGAERLRRVAALISDLRGDGFDAAIDLHGNARSGLLAWASGAPLRIGFDGSISREGNALWLNRRPAFSPDPLHRTLRALLLAREAGAAEGPPRSPLRVPAPAAAAAGLWLKSAVGDDPFLLLHAGSSASPKGRFKRWAPERFAALADRLSGRGHRIVLFRGPGDEATLAEVRGRMRAPWIETPPFPLPEALEVLSRARVAVGSDSGPMHLAAALGTPAVVVFGPKDPAHYGPIAGPHRSLYHPLPCSPCRNTACPHLRCLELVTVEEAEAAVEDLLAEVRRPGRGS